MSQAKNPRRPYIRSMQGWWRKNPYFVEYMVHEGTALFVAAYALVLLVGLIRLAQGEDTWSGWLSAMGHPLALVFHGLALIAISYHSYTWFKIMPKTVPPIVVGGKRLSPTAITGGGLAAVAVATLGVFALFWWMTS